jgi:hypothetical protein
MKTANTENETAPENVTPAPMRSETFSFTVPADMLRAALTACAPAMSKDPNRYVLNGLNLELSPAPKKGGAPFMTLVGCDGRRMHAAQIPFVYAPAGDVLPVARWSFVIPAAVVKSALKIALPKKLKGAAVARVCFFRHAAGLVNSSPVDWIEISTPAGVVSSPQAITGCNYPLIRQVIPSLMAIGGAGPVHVPLASLRAAVRREDEATADCLARFAAWGADVAAFHSAGAMQGRAAGETIAKGAIREALSRDNTCRLHIVSFTVAGGVNAMRLDPVPFEYAGDLPAATACQVNPAQPPARFIGAPSLKTLTRQTLSGYHPVTAINPAYIKDACAALDAIESCPGFPPLPPDAFTRNPGTSGGAWGPVEIENPAFDCGTSAGFTVVLMPQRIA